MTHTAIKEVRTYWSASAVHTWHSKHITMVIEILLHSSQKCAVFTAFVSNYPVLTL